MRSPGPSSLWPAFGLGLAVAIGNGLSRFAYALLLPAMRADLGWTYAQAGWLNTANAVGYVLGAISGYWLLRRFSTPGLFICGLIVCVAALCATGWHASLAWLSTLRLLSGVGAAWSYACGGALVQLRYQHDLGRRGAATGLYFTGAGVGIVASGLLVNPMLAGSGAQAWPMAWLALGAAGVLMAIYPVVDAWRLRGAQDGQAATAQQRSRLQWSLHPLGTCLAAYFCFGIGYIAYMTFIFALVQHRGLSWQFGTWVWVLLGLAAAAAPLVWRRALGAWPAQYTFSLSCMATLAGALIPLSGFDAAMPVSAALFGASVFIVPASVGVLLRQCLPGEQIARAMALFTTAFAVGQAIGPLLAGAFADRYGLDAVLWCGAVLLVAAALLALAGRGQPAQRHREK